MFDPEKLLGGLLRRGLSPRGRRTAGGTGALNGLGLLGLAMGMVESFRGQNGADQTTRSSDAYSAPPPPPPPSPGMQGQAVAPPPPPLPSDQEERHALAILLIRAMITAANSDNVIDEAERERIIRRMIELDLSPEERQFLDREMAHPLTTRELAEQVHSDQAARQVYVASMLAIDIDTADEVVYLNDLAGRLGISPEEVEKIQDELGLPRG